MEIWLNGAVVAERQFNRPPEKGDLIALQINGNVRDYVVDRKLVHYDLNG